MRTIKFLLPVAALFLFACQKDNTQLSQVKKGNSGLSTLKKSDAAIVDTGKVNQKMLFGEGPGGHTEEE